MIVSKSSLWALKALTHMARSQSGTLFLTNDLAAATGAPRYGLAKVLRRLAFAGILITQRGIAGGVLLAQPPESIGVLAVLAALHDPLVMADSDASGAEPAPSALGQLLASLRAEALDRLQAATVADLLPPALPGHASPSQPARTSSGNPTLLQETDQ